MEAEETIENAVTTETTEASNEPNSLLENVDPSTEFNPVDNPDGHPDWFKHNKYKTVEDQAKAYTELEKKFGGFTGAPDEYEIQLAEGVEFEIPEDDPLLNDFKEFAKSVNMSNDAFNQFANLYIEQELAHEKLNEEYRNNYASEQMKLLGDKSEERLQNVAQWAKATLGDETLFNKFQAGLTNAASVEVFEALMAKSKNAPQATSHQQPAAPAMTMEQIHEMQFALDEFGNRKMQDPEYAAKVRAEIAKLKGNKHSPQII